MNDTAVMNAASESTSAAASDYKGPSNVSTTNACKLCTPLGATLAFKGIENAVSFLHGSQGCATYMRRYIISHFREPMDIASSALGEKNAIYGGGPNLKKGLLNAMQKYGAGVIGVATTCLTETIGDDVARLLADYEEAKLNVWFMDCTSEFGVPCYKAVVLGRHGDVNKGMGAHLSGPRAAISAMTEIPYPFPGPATLPVPENLPVRVLEDLPDFSTGSAEGDLMVLEQTLVESGYPPTYVDLTRADLGIPAVRALVPGLEWVADFDRFSRLSPRLYANYLRQFRAL